MTLVAHNDSNVDIMPMPKVPFRIDTTVRAVKGAKDFSSAVSEGVSFAQTATLIPGTYVSQAVDVGANCGFCKQLVYVDRALYRNEH